MVIGNYCYYKKVSLRAQKYTCQRPFMGSELMEARKNLEYENRSDLDVGAKVGYVACLLALTYN